VSVHGGQPDSYLQLKPAVGSPAATPNTPPSSGGPPPAVGTAPRKRCRSAAIMSAADVSNQLARETVEIAGRQWAVGDRVIARRNDRGRDLDNDMRATITHIEQNRLTIQADTGGARQLDPDHVSHHLEHAYALTGHGMQSGTVNWAAGGRAGRRLHP
jgi:hypothetical protein